MLRSIHSRLVRRHPVYFPARFGRSIFDQVPGVTKQRVSPRAEGIESARHRVEGERTPPASRVTNRDRSKVATD